MERILAQGVNQDEIQNLIFVHSLYSQNQLSDPLLRDADNLRTPLGSNGSRLYQQEALGSGYDADDSGDSPTVFSPFLVLAESPTHPSKMSLVWTELFGCNDKYIARLSLVLKDNRGQLSVR